MILFIYLSFYLSIYLSYLSTYLSFYSIHSIYSIYLSLYLSVGLSTCLFSNNFNRSTGTHSKQDTCHESLYTALGNNVTKKQFKQLQSMDVDTLQTGYVP